MQRTSDSRAALRRVALPFASVTLFLALALASSSRAERGPEIEDAPELEAAIESGEAPAAAAVPGQDADVESLRDLEKVIEIEDAKPVVARNNSAATAQEDVVVEPDNDVAIEAEPVGRKGRPQRRTDTEFAAEEVVPAQTRVAPPPPPGRRNTITNLEFKMNGDKSRLVVTAPFGLQYREVRNAGMRQVVYYFENVETPERLQRAYDTSEFPSPVALFTLLQVPGQRPPASKLIIQLREDKLPTVTPHDRGLFIEFPEPTAGAEVESLLAQANGRIRGEEPKGLEDEENLYSNKQKFVGKRIKRLEVKNSEVQDVLRLIAKSSGYNIVIGDDVSGKIGTLSLENVPWDQAFALVLQSKKLGYSRSGNVLRVNTIGTLKSEKEDAASAEEARIKLEPLRTVLIPVNYATAKDVEGQIKPFLTKDRGSSQIDERTNTVIVKDIDRSVKRIQKLVSAIDLAPSRVAISAKFVEMSTRFGSALGATLSGRQNFSGLNFDFATGFSSAQASTMTIAAPNFAALTARLDIGETEQKVRTLANPSVTVVANTQASLKRTFTFFQPQSTSTNGGITTTLQPVTTTLSLQVTPQVTGDGSIFLDVNLKNEVPLSDNGTTTIDGRDVKTKVLLDNGDTAVLGGVFSSQFTHSTGGVPILGRIPILGKIFSRQSESDQRSEVYIFITARITNAEDSFKKAF